MRSRMSKMLLGVCYYPEHWDEAMWSSDVSEMKSLGLSVVRIGEFAWSRLEPVEGQYDFDWLDRIIQLLDDSNLKFILGTPSATPPRWVLDKYPDMLAWDEQGKERGFGSRRHYCFSHTGYRQLASEMAGRLAQRYGSHPSLYAWQTDNEYGCHDTTRSYSPHALMAFQKWLEDKYNSISELNQRWGNVFWSMEYNSFEQIELPNLTVTEPNPIHKLDFFRFCSDQVVVWNKAQVDAIHNYSDAPIFHNYMGRITDFDHFKLGEDLDLATWDSYPLGFLEDRSDRPSSFKHKYQYTGDPDFQAFHHDLYRAVGKGRWGIMEQQPGPVNWAPHNPSPASGMVRLWTLEAMAHGAEFVAFFRWRQPPFAQEQMHSALKRPDNRPSPMLSELKQLKEDLNSYDIQKIKSQSINQTLVALIFDYESQWAWEVQPQGEDFDYFRLCYEFYCGLRMLGLDVDIISSDCTSLKQYEMVLAPGIFCINDNLIALMSDYRGEVILGPRTHTKTTDFQINTTSVSQLMELPLVLDMVETLRPSASRVIDKVGIFHRWMEHIQHEDKALEPVIHNNNKTYIAGWPDENTLQNILITCLERANIPYDVQQASTRIRSKFVIDYMMEEEFRELSI